jgi:hypothetical protein
MTSYGSRVGRPSPRCFTRAPGRCTPRDRRTDSVRRWGVAGREFFAEYDAAQVQGPPKRSWTSSRSLSGPIFPALNRATKHLGAGLSSAVLRTSSPQSVIEAVAA